MKIIIKQEVKRNDPKILVDFIGEYSKLSKMKIKKALNDGCGWIKDKGRKSARVARKAKKELKTGQQVEFYYDTSVMEAEVPEPVLVHETKNWGVWYKPSGLLAQGSKFGDRFSIERIISKNLNKDIFLIHRLDREASGLMIFAYNKQAATDLGNIWKNAQVRKVYQAQVLGILGLKDEVGKIDLALDDKESHTTYKVVEVDEGSQTTLVEVRIKTGRFHQIRRHFNMIDHPVMGDPRYGEDNKNKDGLKLVASQLSFKDPFAKKAVVINLQKNFSLF